MNSRSDEHQFACEEFMIRKVETRDADALVRLLSQLGYQVSEAEAVKSILAVADGTHEIYVGVLGTEVVAAISLIAFPYFPSGSRYCRVTALVVDEQSRGKGFGKQLMAKASVRAWELTCSVMEVTTSMQRLATHKFYEGLGFEKTSFKYVLPLADKTT